MSNRTAIITVTGQHIGNRTADDVDVLAIFESNMTFIPEILYTTFWNINEIDIEFAGLEELEQLPHLVNLQFFVMWGENITTIPNNTFVNVNETLIDVELVNNGHQILEVDAFAELGRLIFLYILYNDLPHPEPGTFAPLTNLGLIDFDSNNFGIIENELFENNRNLIIIFCERNGIDRISPTFSAPFSDSFAGLAAYGNDCINRGFNINDELDVAFLNTALQRCYNNFAGIEQNSTRSVTFEYRGSLRLFDEFGNLILSAN